MSKTARIFNLIVFSSIFCSLTVCAVPQIVSNTVQSTKKMFKQHVTHPFYFGGSLGYGNTDWSEITTAPSTETVFNPATLSAPIGATQGGVAFGGYIGYQFSEHFTVEGIYTHYPMTKVTFSQDGNNYNIGELKTNTNAYSLVGKIMVPFGFTKIYVYADAGVTYVMRDDNQTTPLPDEIPNFKEEHIGHFGPSFGFGLAYDITPRIFTESSFQYTTGYGKADMRPAEDYIPFVYSLMMSLGVRV